MIFFQDTILNDFIYTKLLKNILIEYNIKLHNEKGDFMLDILELIKKTKLSKKDFSDFYKIPYHSILNWTCNKKSKSFRECPQYVLHLLNRLVETDFVERENFEKLKPSQRLIIKKKEIKSLFKSYEQYGISNPRIFGSVARGDDDIDSDVDFAIDFDTKENISLVKYYLRLKVELKKILNCEVDLVNYLNVLPLFKDSIDKEGVLL